MFHLFQLNLYSMHPRLNNAWLIHSTYKHYLLPFLSFFVCIYSFHFFMDGFIWHLHDRVNCLSHLLYFWYSNICIIFTVHVWLSVLFLELMIDAIMQQPLRHVTVFNDSILICMRFLKTIISSYIVIYHLLYETRKIINVESRSQKNVKRKINVESFLLYVTYCIYS